MSRQMIARQYRDPDPQPGLRRAVFLTIFSNLVLLVSGRLHPDRRPRSLLSEYNTMKPGYPLSKISKWRFSFSLLPTAQCIGREKTSTSLPPTTSFRPKTAENAGIHESTDPSALTADCGRKAAKGRRQRQPAPLLRCLARLVHSCSARLARASRPFSLDASVNDGASEIRMS